MSMWQQQCSCLQNTSIPLVRSHTFPPLYSVKPVLLCNGPVFILFKCMNVKYYHRSYSQSRKIIFILKLLQTKRKVGDESILLNVRSKLRIGVELFVFPVK